MFFSKEKSFDQLFADVPEQQTAQLLTFREQAPYKEIMVNAYTWRYRVFGDGFQTMILLPGGFTLADIWMQTAQAFAADYRILMPDAYARQGIFDVDQVCEAIISMMDEEQTKQAVFIGLAAGGDLAQYFLHQHPQRVQHLILSHCDIIGDGSIKDDTRNRRTLDFYRRTPEKMIRKMMLRQLEKDLSRESDWSAYTIAYYRESIQSLQKKVVLEFVQNAYTMKKEFEFQVSRIHNWQGEVLFLASEDDTITLGSVTPLKKFYPQAKAHRFAQGRNHVHLLFADQVKQVVKDFLENSHD
ncbi:MAG: alpha/beta hydrolase [Anaerolineaceae bacterium]|nr:alpha/beta hydrolase [Anaerolineaceae bacterium]